jgi:hypothetical protein
VLPGKNQAKNSLRHAIQMAASIGRDEQTPRDFYLALSALHARYEQGTPAAPDDDLTAAELRVSSQNGEDGVLAEILRRTGTAARPYFVEFGTESGSQANCVFLADARGWDGLFIEGSPEHHARLAAKYAPNPRVRTVNAMVFPENVEALFADASVPDEPDVLSIDVDGQDWWIWRALERYRPRVLVIEYNAGIPHDALLAEPHGHVSQVRGFTGYFGASIGAMEALGRAKGYRLVHTELTGANAFFVRDDLPGPWPDAERVVRRGLNYGLRSTGHPADPLGREYVDVSTHLPRPAA